ncbi:MAG TPA: hypothetical protein VF862_10855 [Gemmatimonadales bacterium]
MSRTRMSILFLAGLAWFPAGAAAQHNHDVILHVNPRWKECAIQLDPALTQEAWRQFVEEGGMLIYFRPLTDARPMGRGNWEISALRWQTGIDDTEAAWNDTFVHPNETHWLYEGDGLAFPGLTARVGVSSRIDVGAYFTKNVQSNYGVAGAQMQYAFVRDPESPWGAAARLSVVSLFGPADVNLGAVGLDLVASRRLDIVRRVSVTPYVGWSSIVSAGRETSDAVALESEVAPSSQVMGGAVLQVAMVRIGAEFTTGRVATRSLKVGVAF